MHSAPNSLRVIIAVRPFSLGYVSSVPGFLSDKGYHSGAVVQRVKSYQVRSYIPEAAEGAAQLAGQGRGTAGRSIRTGGGCEAACSGGAASWWNAASRIAMKRAACGAAT